MNHPNIDDPNLSGDDLKQIAQEVAKEAFPETTAEERGKIGDYVAENFDKNGDPLD